MVTINNLQFSYGSETVLKDISLKLEEGKIYGLLGENGVGKTTLLTLICGLKNPQYGTIDIDGQIPYDREPSFLENIYYLPDEVQPLPYKAIDFASDRGRFWKNFDLSTFMEIMKLLENDSNQRMDRMSLGQLKKTYISFALACRCKYIIMDEPTNGLDIPSKAQFRKAVTRYTSDDSTILISTHQVRDLENIIDPIIILDRRNVLLNASIDQISKKLFFDYTSEHNPDALYSEMIPGCSVQVSINKTGAESKVNIEALFNTAHIHKSFFMDLFK
jgi:ABC-2 type transport system ATP-binding protein